MQMRSEKLPFPLIVFIILLFTSFIADGADVFDYRQFLKEHGVGWLNSPGWKLTFEYFTTFPGNFLTAIVFSPWRIAFIFISWPKNIHQLVLTARTDYNQEDAPDRKNLRGFS